MWGKLLKLTSLVILVVGCGDSDPGGLYAEPDGGTTGSYKSGPDGGGFSAGGAPAATGGASSGSGGSATGGSGGSESSTGGGSAGGEPGEPPSEGGPTKCKGDKPCAPLVCLKKLGVCGPPALPGTKCERDLECLSDKCEEGYCE